MDYYRPKTHLIWLLSSLFLVLFQIKGETRLIHRGIVGGSQVATAGQYRIHANIGHAYTPELLSKNNIMAGVGLLAGIENPPHTKKYATSEGEENVRIEFSYSEIIENFNIFDSDGDEIEIRLEALSGEITSDVINPGNIIHWTPPVNENRDINAIKVIVSDGRVNEVEGVLVAYLKPEPYQLFFLKEPIGGYTILNESIASQVRIADRNGITISTASNNVFLSILPGTSSTGAFFYGQNSSFAVDGIADFSSLKINKPGEKYQLIASSPGLLSATSSAFKLQDIARNEIKDQPGYPSFVTTDIVTINAPISALNSNGDIIHNKLFPGKDPKEIEPKDAPIGVDPNRVPDHLKPKAIDQEFNLTMNNKLDIALNIVDPQNRGLQVDVIEFPEYGRIGNIIYESIATNKNIAFTSGLEIGDEVIISEGAFSITDFEYDVWSVFDANENPSLNLIIYKNDGILVNENQSKPNTIIYKSEPINLKKGYQKINLKNLNLNLKNNFTWSIKFNGLKNTINSRAGLVLGDSATEGQSYKNYWEKINGEWLLGGETSTGAKNNYSAKIWAYKNSGTTLSYTPNIGFIGNDSFEYSIVNFVNLKDSAKVKIHVKGVLPSPIKNINKSIHTIAIRVLPSNPFTFEFPTLNNFTYIIESTNNFFDWIPVKVIVGDNTVHQYSYRDDFNSNYYRVKVVQ